MKLLSISAILVFLLFSYTHLNAANISDNHFIFHTQFSLTDISDNAKVTGKWSLLFCTLEDNDACAQQEHIMMNSKDFNNFISPNFIAYKFDAFNDIEKTQNWDIRQFPAILVLNEKGEEVLRMSGNHDIEEIVNKISLVPGFISSAKIENELAYSQKRGIDATFAIVDVDPFEYYSVSMIREEGFGLRIGTYSTKEALQAELNKITKAWHKEIFIYSQIDKNKECFNLVLGNFQEYEDARQMQNLILNDLLMKSSVISLGKIKNRFVEK